MWSVDGMEWNLPCDIERVSEIRETDISGWLMDGTYFRDVQGQYMVYTVSLVVPKAYSYVYATLYEILTDPTSATHTFWFPYNQTAVSVTGKIDQVTDQYVRDGSSGILWRHTKFTVTATSPRRT